LTGKRPFEGKTADEIASQHASAPIVEPHRVSDDVPEELSAMVAKMMAKQPEDRFQDMTDVIDQLEEFLGIKQAGRSHCSAGVGARHRAAGFDSSRVFVCDSY